MGGPSRPPLLRMSIKNPSALPSLWTPTTSVSTVMWMATVAPNTRPYAALNAASSGNVEDRGPRSNTIARRITEAASCCTWWERQNTVWVSADGELSYQEINSQHSYKSNYVVCVFFCGSHHWEQHLQFRCFWHAMTIKASFLLYGRSYFSLCLSI